MGLALDLDFFKEKLEEIISSPRLVLRESFMMNMFAKISNDLMPMKEYWDHLFNRD